MDMVLKMLGQEKAEPRLIPIPSLITNDSPIPPKLSTVGYA